MTITKNTVVAGSAGRPMLTDIFFEPAEGPKPCIICAHGFNGFKDWGGMDEVAKTAARAGFVFVKLNFSHNGTTQETPEEFADLKAYSENNYTRELNDLSLIIDWLTTANPHAAAIDGARIGLIGHSRGGGIVLIKAAEDARVKAVATWASVSECKTPWGGWPAARMAEWARTGTAYITNSRTRQELPLGYQLHEDYMQHSARLNISTAIARLRIPILVCHGTADTSVPVAAAYALQKAQPSVELFTLATDHVFGRMHPWNEPDLPEAMRLVLRRTLAFFEDHL